jgi:serine/threonine protein kinase
MSMTDPLIGKKLGDYLIEGIQGTGGMARVYRGFDEKLERYAAVKVIEPQLIASAEEEEYRERFLREARSIARLSHPRVVGIYQFGQYENLYYIAMEYIEGRNLREILKGYAKQDVHMPIPEVLSVLGDIGSALDYAHRQSIIHRDVKPSNIIVNTEGNAVLTDFGLALNALEGTIGNTFGSVHYIAPEQAISSAQAVAQSDQYSLAIIAYEMLTGRVPFDDASAMSVALKHISDPPPPPRDINPNIPIEVEQVLTKALDKDLHKRYVTCQDFMKALEEAYATASDELPPPVVKKDRTLSTTGSTSSRPTQAPIEEDAPTIRDTSSQPKTVSAKTEGTVKPPLPAGANNRMLLGGGAVVAVLVILGIMVLPSLMNPAANPANMTGTAVAAAETAIPITFTAQARIDAAIESTTQARFTATAQAQANASLTAAAEAIVTGTAQAALDEAATQTQSAADDITATAEESTNSTATAAEVAAVSASQTATALTVVPTEEPTVNTTATAQAQENATATARAAVTETPSPTPTRTPEPATPTNTPAPTATPTPGLAMVDDADAPLLLHYDGRALVLYNRDNQNVSFDDLSNLQFHLFEPDENGDMVETAVYEGSEWAIASRGLAPRTCLLVFPATSFREYPAGDSPTDICALTPVRVFKGTRQVFWLSAQASQGAYFEVRRGPVDLITTCQANIPQTFNTKRCAVRLR